MLWFCSGHVRQVTPRWAIHTDHGGARVLSLVFPSHANGALGSRRHELFSSHAKQTIGDFVVVVLNGTSVEQVPTCRTVLACGRRNDVLILVFSFHTNGAICCLSSKGSPGLAIQTIHFFVVMTCRQRKRHRIKSFVRMVKGIPAGAAIKTHLGRVETDCITVCASGTHLADHGGPNTGHVFPWKTSCALLKLV